MNRRIKCFVLVFVLLALAVAPLTFAYAQTIEPYASAIIQSYAVSMSRGNGGVVTAATSIIGKPLNGCDKLGFTYLRIQENRDGTWVSVKAAANKFGYDAKQHSYSMSYDGTVGKQYRATVSFLAQLGADSETRSSTSVTVTARN